jgi:hypothetical protein
VRWTALVCKKPSWYENINSLQTYPGSNKEAADNHGDTAEIRKGSQQDTSKVSIQGKNGARRNEG